MSKISMDLVKELREKTQVSMMECKKALEESNGDIEKAIEILRKRGTAIAAKRAENATNNGRIEAFVSSDFKKGALVEVVCETDFSANTQAMKDFVEAVAQTAAQESLNDKDALIEKHEHLKHRYEELLAKITEKIAINKVVTYSTTQGLVNAYIHPGSTVGVLIELGLEKESGSNLEELKQLARDLCMQIAVNKPLGVAPEHIDPTLIEKERAIIKEQLKDDKRPENILQKIVDGRLNKFYEDVCLTHQKFIKNDKISISQHVTELSNKLHNKIVIKGFTRFAIGNR